jgi:hypothetical protein
MQTVNMLIILPMADAELARIADLDRRIHLLAERGMFGCELAQTWPAWTVQRYTAGRHATASTREE